MKNEEYIIGIDVYRSRYDACFYNIDSNKSKYYKGSLTNDYGKIRLINRIDKENLIIINESLLAAELMIRFSTQVTIINDEIISLLINAKVPRGTKMASFFIRNFKSKKTENLSKTMIANLLLESEKRLTSQESLCNDSISIFDNIIDGKNVNLKKIHDLEERTRKFNNHSGVHLNKVDEVEKMIEQFDKLNELFDE